MSTFFGFRLALLAAMSSPAFEKTRSLGTDVDGMDRNLLASFANLGSPCALCVRLPPN